MCVTGVSGSGKSTLVNDLLHFRLSTGDISGGSGRLFGFDALHGAENVDEVMLVDQSPIGRSARSNPATYLQVLAPIRDLFAATKDARARGWTAGASASTPRGALPDLPGHGLGHGRDAVHGRHHRALRGLPRQALRTTTLEMRYTGLNIAEMLDLTVDEALQFFADTPAIGSAAVAAAEGGPGLPEAGPAGADPVRRREPAHEGGARTARARARGNLYLLDEPTTGLHAEDVRALVKVLHELVEEGHTVLVIEHNLDLIKNADWVIDLGPGGGPEGGRSWWRDRRRVGA